MLLAKCGIFECGLYFRFLVDRPKIGAPARLVGRPGGAAFFVRPWQGAAAVVARRRREGLAALGAGGRKGARSSGVVLEGESVTP